MSDFFNVASKFDHRRVFSRFNNLLRTGLILTINQDNALWKTWQHCMNVVEEKLTYFSDGNGKINHWMALSWFNSFLKMELILMIEELRKLISLYALRWPKLPKGSLQIMSFRNMATLHGVEITWFLSSHRPVLRRKDSFANDNAMLHFFSCALFPNMQRFGIFRSFCNHCKHVQLYVYATWNDVMCTKLRVKLLNWKLLHVPIPSESYTLQIFLLVRTIFLKLGSMTIFLFLNASFHKSFLMINHSA